MFEVRASESGKERRLTGYAARYGVLSNEIRGKDGAFREKIVRGAFDEVLASKPDVVMTLNHDMNKVLGRTTSGTLKLRVDDKGLRFDCLLPNTSYARDLHESVKRGDMNGCSFAFADVDDEWSEDSELDYGSSNTNYARTIKKFVLRTIKTFRKLFDVSVVTTPAYPGTQISTRNLAAAAEFRSREQWKNSTPEQRLDMFCSARKLNRAEFTTDAKGDFVWLGNAEVIRRRKMLLNAVSV